MGTLGSLGELRAALEPARPAGRAAAAGPPPAAADGLPSVLESSGVVQEVFARHGHSAQPESQQVVAILRAVLEVLAVEGLAPSPTALFAALMASLEKPESLASNAMLAAMCTLLALVLPRLPTAVLRSKFGQSATALAAVAEAKQEDAAVLRPALGCLAQVLAAAGVADWPAALRPLNILLSGCLDHRPKVRKRATGGLVDVLAGLQRSPAALAPASDAVLALCRRVVPAPEAAARAAAAAPHKRRAAAEEAITAAVADALHLLGALKQCIFLLSGAAVAPVAELLLKLYALRQPLLSRHTSDALAALAASSASHLPPRALAQLLGAVLVEPAAWEAKDADAALALTRLVEEGFTALHRADPALCAAHLPRAFHALAPALGAEAGAVRAAAGRCLRALAAGCVDEGLAAAAGATGGGGPGPLRSIVSAIEGVLGARYPDCWLLALPGVPCGRRGREAAWADALVAAAQGALGAALRALGPEAVLEVLPLNLEEALDSGAEARTWLLPLLREHVRGARLAYWGGALLPLAKAMAARAAAARARGEAGQREAQVCAALEAQLWATLPAFCSWALDAGAAFRRGAAAARAGALLPAQLSERGGGRGEGGEPKHARDLAAAFEKRPDLRIGFSEPAAIREDGEAAAAVEEEDEDEVPDYFTAEMAAANIAMLRGMAKNWLPLLLNAFLAAPPEQRGHIQAAAAAYACVCETPTLAPFFRTAIAKLLREKSPAVQKKAYKVLAYLAGRRPDATGALGPALAELAAGGGATAVSAARRYRLAFVRAVALGLVRDEAAREAALAPGGPLPAMVSEVVLALKEANKRTRAEAYALLVEMGGALAEAAPAQGGDPHSGGLYKLFSIVLGGLVGTTPHMISASVMALARLLYEFAPALAGLVPKLLPAVLLLLRSKAREVIKSVLGFVKVCVVVVVVVVVRLPAEGLAPFVGPILEGILLWAEDSKNKFRAKVRVIVERLARKRGYAEVEAHTPEAHRKLLTHIRKQSNRAERAKSEAGSQMDWEEEGTVHTRQSGRSGRTGRTGRTGRFTDMLSDDTGDARTATGRAASTRGGGGGGGGGSDPVDLLDARTSRQLVRAAAGGGPARRGAGGKGEDDFKRDPSSGRMIVEEEKAAGGKRKRGAGDNALGIDDSDSDYDDLRQFEPSGLSLALRGARSVAAAPSIAASFKSQGRGGARSEGGASRRGAGKQGKGGKSHTSGERYKPRKAGGDVKGKSKLEPFAYWPLDRRLLNARREKRREGREGLGKVVATGGKAAKRARTQ
eukprot:scaffold11.g3957.t1